MFNRTRAVSSIKSAAGPALTSVPPRAPTPPKASIPRALREQVWIHYAGRRFEHKCLIPWCKNTMTVFDFHVGHDVPESVGGATELHNLRPICARCNLSMGAHYSIQEWSRLSKKVDRPWYARLCRGFVCGY